MPGSFKAPGQPGARPVPPTTRIWLWALNANHSQFYKSGVITRNCSQPGPDQFLDFKIRSALILTKSEIHNYYTWISYAKAYREMPHIWAQHKRITNPGIIMRKRTGRCHTFGLNTSACMQIIGVTQMCA